MKFPSKGLFSRIKKRCSLGNGSKHGESCVSNGISDPSVSNSQDLSNHRDTGSKNGSQPFSSKDFTLPADSSVYTLGDELAEPLCASEAHRSASQHRPSSRINSSCPRQSLETIASESKLEIEDELQTTKQIPATYKEMDHHDLQSSAIADMITESPESSKAYDLVPVLEQTKLPRGGVSIETKAVGRVQFGIPPETIKDSMRLGIPVPQVYIVPVERFCREMGPALGVNLAEFEFPAYFNFFVYKKKCTLIVDSEDAEENIRRVFSETLLGPAQFRREKNPIAFEEEDFAPDFPREAIPNFQKEFKHFRIMPDGQELVLETLLNFCHFETKGGAQDNLGVPPPLEGSFRGQERTLSRASSFDTDEDDEALPKDLTEVERREMKKNKWTYSQAKFVGDVAVVWPFEATEDQIKNRSVPRVEIFKMPGGTEYMLHDIDMNNHIIGRARISGHVRVSEFMSVEGFGGHSILDDIVPRPKASLTEKPDYFHPPSFGVTVLGNSHGFDKSGSVSGYVLWINGRGVMIDPPPYSSATLEREGIRPRAIVGIILTHCHADHDAGAFQKVLTGSPVVVITTPTIYKSFIRKYAALSALSPALLRHSHRYKPAFIGQPLRFQGATFHFTYTLHTIPCVGFRVEWRGRSMVFTGDHFNSPPAIQKLTETGVLSQARADDLTSLPLQDTDLLLHEAGAPPIHTPLDVLLQLPEHVKKRLFVVHTSALPEGCELRVAPTGTAGTIRLDQNQLPNAQGSLSRVGRDNVSASGLSTDDLTWSGQDEYHTVSEDAGSAFLTSFNSNEGVGQRAGKGRARATSMFAVRGVAPPLVSLRPASSTDAWFILNLLSAVPFLSSLSYAATMEVLETARVDAYASGDVIVPATRRANVLCVVWEGMCAERKASRVASRLPLSASDLITIKEDKSEYESGSVWHPGDWTGPIVLQPDRKLSGESSSSYDHDVVAVSSVGVKVITVEFAGLHRILKSGSPLYRKYLDRKAVQDRVNKDLTTHTDHSNSTEKMLEDALKDLNILELLNCNSALRKLTAVQKRHLESLAEGPIVFQPGERLWRAGTPVDKAFIIVSGTASFAPKRRNAGSAVVASSGNKVRDCDKDNKLGDPQIGEAMQADAIKAMKELGVVPSHEHGRGGDDEWSVSSAEDGEARHRRPSQIQFPVSGGGGAIGGGGGAIGGGGGMLGCAVTDRRGSGYSQEYDRLSRGLQKRADYLQKEGSVTSENMSIEDPEDLDSCETETESMLDFTFTDDADPVSRSRRASVIRRRSSRARFANKVLGRLYSRRAFTGGLVFSRGHFLGDVSKMVAGLLSSEGQTEVHGDDGAPSYGFGDHREGLPPASDRLFDSVVSDMVIHEQEEDHYIMHNSTLTAGKDGCVVLVFPKSSLIPFMDEYPGLLLSLLGTQVVV